jgi:hypothetical protein
MMISEPLFTMQPVPDHYELRPHGRLAWLQRLIWRALHKMNALVLGMEDCVTFKTVTIDAERVIDQVAEAKSRLRYGATRVLLGPSEMSEIMRDPTFRDMAFHAEPTSVRPPTFLGLTIEIVPHMQGVLVL